MYVINCNFLLFGFFFFSYFESGKQILDLEAKDRLLAELPAALSWRWLVLIVNPTLKFYFSSQSLLGLMCFRSPLLKPKKTQTIH